MQEPPDQQAAPLLCSVEWRCTSAGFHKTGRAGRVDQRLRFAPAKLAVRVGALARGAKFAGRLALRAPKVCAGLLMAVRLAVVVCGANFRAAVVVLAVLACRC